MIIKQITLEKSQSPSQVGQPPGLPLQISQEQLQQLQHNMQLQQAAQFTAIQVKQEYPSQNQLGTPNSIANDLKHQIVEQGHGQLQQMQLIEAPSVSPHHVPNSASIGNPTTTISTMSPMQDWSQGRLQLIQPSIPNQGYLQHLYPPVIMSGNIIHSGIGQQPIQVIATGKPFAGGGPQMITAQNKQLLGTNSTNFSGSYTLPGIPSSQSQALVFSPVSVLNSQPQQQQSIMPAINTQQTPKSSQQEFQKSLQNQKIIQKVNTNNSITNTQNINGSNTNIHSTQQCVQVSQAMPTAQILSPIQQASAQSMQITSSPWMQGVPHFWTNGIQPQTLLAQNPIIIRGTQSDGTQGMFIQQATTHHAIQNQQANPQTLMQCNIPQANKSKMQIESISKQHQPRTPLILPQNTPSNRPASNVSTQTAQNQNLFGQKPIKRNKQQAVRPALTVMKSDSSVQIKSGIHQMAQQHSMHQVVTSGGNKMVVVSTGQPINLQNSSNVHSQNINTADKQMQQLKHQQSLIHQQQLQQQIMQQNPNQQFLQHQIAQQIQLQQHPQQQSQQHLHSGIQSGSFLSQPQQSLNQFTTNHEQQRELTSSGIVHQIVVQQNQQHVPQVSNITNILPANTTTQQSLNVQAKHTSIPLEKQKCTVNCQQQTLNPNVSILSSQNPSGTNIICSEPPIANAVPSSVPIPLSTPSNTILAMTTFTTSVLPTTTVSTGITSSTSLRFEKSKSDTSIKHERNITEDENYNNINSRKLEDKIEGSIVSNLEEITKTDTIKHGAVDENSKKGTVSPADDRQINIETCKSINSEENVSRSCVKIKNPIKNEKELPKAMIKPNVLTHVIEGFVIQEGSEPFSLTRIRYSEKDNLEEPPNKRQTLNESNINSEASATAACENCGKRELRSKLKRKRFCSSLCARGRKSFNEEDKNLDVSNSTDEIKSIEPTEKNSQIVDKPKAELEQNTTHASNQEESHLMHWSVSDVCDFIKNLPGCNDYADDFALQEIDGQALLLLKENHLVNAMGMKLGPALKIVAKVESIKEGNIEKETH